MSKIKRLIVYVGDQRDLFGEIERYFSRRDDHFFFHECRQTLQVEDLFDLYQNESPALVILDFCADKHSFERMEAMATIKKWHVGGGVPVCGVFEQKEQLRQKESLFGLGMNYAFLKGVDTKQSLNTLFYIAFEDEAPCLNYALAKVGKIPAVVHSMGYIGSFDENSFEVDKDFRSEGEEIVMDTDLFDDFKVKKFEPVETFEGGFVFDAPFAETMRVPFASGWEADEEEAVFEDTFQSWISLNEESFVKNQDVVLVYSSSPLAAKTAWKWNLENGGAVKVCPRGRFEPGRKEILKLKPGLIIFEIDGSESYDALAEMLAQMSYEKELENCIVSVFSHPSTSKALRKLYSRRSLIASKEKLSGDVMLEMLKRLSKTPARLSSYSFKSSDPRLNVSFPLDVRVTSLTENEITFMASEELPLYSIIKLREPVSSYAVIAPSLKKLSPNIHGHHYMAFLFGGDLEEGRYWRKFVNYILNNDLKVWKEIDFSAHPAPQGGKEESEVPEESVEAPAKEDEGATGQSAGKSEEVLARPKSRNRFSKL